MVGLLRIHRGSMKNFLQASRLEGSWLMEKHRSAKRLAQASLDPFGTCCKVESLAPQMESREGRELHLLGGDGG